MSKHIYINIRVMGRPAAGHDYCVYGPLKGIPPKWDATEWNVAGWPLRHLFRDICRGKGLR